MNTASTTLVLGGTGKTGSRLAKRLTADDRPVRIGSRHGGLPFDWEDPSTWEPALRGIGAAYISYYPDLAAPGAAEAITSFCDLAVARGVRRLVLLSGRGEDEAQAAEKRLADSGAEWTVLRCSWFNQNFSESYLIDPIRSGAVALPAGEVPEPFLDADDVADAAYTVLTENGHAGRVYELTGPRALTFADAVAEIAAATGRAIDFVPVQPQDYAAELAAAQVPAEVTDLLIYLFTTVLDGRNVAVTDGVETLLHRRARDFTHFARRCAASGIWAPFGTEE